MGAITKGSSSDLLDDRSYIPQVSVSPLDLGNHHGAVWAEYAGEDIGVGIPKSMGPSLRGFSMRALLHQAF